MKQRRPPSKTARPEKVGSGPRPAVRDARRAAKGAEPPEIRRLVKAADKLTAYLKAVQEDALSNRESAQAKAALGAQIDELASDGQPDREAERFL